jgi:hypothetical protein
LTTLLDADNVEKEGFAIVYFADNGFEIFASNLDDIKLETMLTTYPTLMGIMQDQEIKGLATTKINEKSFLLAFAINLKNLDANDARLKHKTVTIINFIVSREIYKQLMVCFDEFELFLEKYFEPIVFLFDLYAVDLTKIIPIFLEKLEREEKLTRLGDSKRREISLASEFRKWLIDSDSIESND